MSDKDWYRQEVWGEEIERKFFEKLKRARDKAQYLRIQACTIAEKEPDVALALLDRYFSYNENMGEAAAYCHQATAYLAKSEVVNAIDAYSKALEVESKSPSLNTDAYILYSLTIIENKLTELYDSANKILEEHQRRLTFPVDHFRWHAAKAMIEAQNGNDKNAVIHAEVALKAAQIKKSGFRFHQNLGLVGKEYKWLMDLLSSII